MLGDPAQSHHRSHSRRLPAPGELSLRIEEAKTSAKLLQQVCGSTPRDELLGNDLVKEFVERCSIAQRSMQAFIKAENPLPDDETMLTLINTNDQLSAALSSHHRAILEARKAAGMTTPKPLADSDRGAPPHFPQQSGGELMYPPHPSSQQLLLPNIPMNQIAAPPQASQTILQPQPIRPIQMIEAPPTVPARKRVSPPMADSDDPFKDPTTSSGHFPGSNPSGYAEDGMPVEQHMVSLGYSNDGANRVNKPGVEEKITLNEDASTASHGLQKPLLPQYQVPKRLGDPEISPPNSVSQSNHLSQDLVEKSMLTDRYPAVPRSPYERGSASKN